MSSSETQNLTPQETLYNVLKGTSPKCSSIDGYWSVMMQLIQTNKDLRSNPVIIEGAVSASTFSAAFMSTMMETIKAKTSGDLKNPDHCSKLTTQFVGFGKDADALIVNIEKSTPEIFESGVKSLDKVVKSLKDQPPKSSEEFEAITNTLNIQRMTFELLKELPGKHHLNAEEKLKQINLAIENIAMEQNKTKKPHCLQAH